MPSYVPSVGTVLKLGTKMHHDALLAGIDRLQPTGCFALTELGASSIPNAKLWAHEPFWWRSCPLLQKVVDLIYLSESAQMPAI